MVSLQCSVSTVSYDSAINLFKNFKVFTPFCSFQKIGLSFLDQKNEKTNIAYDMKSHYFAPIRVSEKQKALFAHYNTFLVKVNVGQCGSAYSFINA
jgi:hypothetical protein